MADPGTAFERAAGSVRAGHLAASLWVGAAVFIAANVIPSVMAAGPAQQVDEAGALQRHVVRGAVRFSAGRGGDEPDGGGAFF